MTASTSEVEIPLRDQNGRELALLRVMPLGAREWNGLPVLLDLRRTEHELSGTAPVQLLEETTYEYAVVAPAGRQVEGVGPEEFVSPSNDSRTGRFKTGRLVGTVPVRVTFSDGSVAHLDLEVRSRKLEYSTEFRSMLSRIAEESAELAQSAFAASEGQSFRPDVFDDPITLYQRFAFLRSLIDGETMRSAFALIANRPHSEHRAMGEMVTPAHGIAAGPSLCREVVKAGPRTPLKLPAMNLTSLPREVARTVHVATYDTVPNRFVRYVVERWRALAIDVQAKLSGAGSSSQRGAREAAELVEVLSQLLLCPALREAGRLTSFPQSNQVLYGREGYREVFEAFVLAEVAPTIEWTGADRVFRAGLRDIAELYEYWTYLELVRTIGTIPGVAVDKTSLLKRTADAMSLDLRRGSGTTVVARTARRGVPLTIEVNFNRFFASGRLSWSIGMRPDCSIHIRRADESAGVWLHFDAKYRAERFDLGEIDEQEAESPSSDEELRPRVADLMKMHAYRDAVRGSVGSYVLYPGSTNAPPQHRRMVHEVLPGIGAFVLRPEPDGKASSASVDALRDFLDDILDHLSAHGTALERNRFWFEQSSAPEGSGRFDRQPFVRRPAQDTRVLLGYVKSREHLDWVLRHGVYNLRADPSRPGAVAIGSEVLSTELLVLYNAGLNLCALASLSGVVTVRSNSDLLALGYPRPNGQHYLCATIQSVLDSEWLTASKIGAVALSLSEGVVGQPVAVTWFDVLSA